MEMEEIHGVESYSNLNGDTNLFCNCYVTGKSAMNIIVTHTSYLYDIGCTVRICSVDEVWGSIYSRLTFQEREKAAETKKEVFRSFNCE